MKRAGGAQMYLLAIMLIGLAGLMLVESWIAKAVLLLIVVVCGYTVYKMEISRLNEKWSHALLGQKRQHDANMLQIVNRLRHDWMNDAQILFGYIQLKKFDKLQPFMGKIKIDMQQETNLAKLGDSSLISTLLLQRAQLKSIQLKFELDQEINLGQLHLREGLIERLIGRVIELFKQYGVNDGDECGELSLEFDLQEECLMIDFVYQGPYDTVLMEQAVRQTLLVEKADYSVELFNLQEDEAAVILRLPFRT